MQEQKSISIADLPYTKEVSRLHKGSYAKQGFVYLKIKHKDAKNNRVFTNYALVDAAIVKDEIREEAFSILWEQLKTKYNL